MPDGQVFVVEDRLAPDGTLYPLEDRERERLAAYFAFLWEQAYLARAPETARLVRLEKLYAGFHYTDPRLNRQREVTNYCFSQVETVHPIMTEVRPRPEIVPREGPLTPQRAKGIARYATWKMDTSGFDRARRLATRDMLRYGWDVVVVDIDGRTGLSRPFVVDPFDFYWDPAGTHEEHCEYFVFAWPVSTRRLRALFPKHADRIQPDNRMSPSYRARVLPYIEESQMDFLEVGPSIGSHLYPVTATNPGGTTVFSAYPEGDQFTYGQTTFLFQFLVRNYRTVPVRYRGYRLLREPTTGMWVRVPGQAMDRDEPECPSGWCVALMTYTGELLDIYPVDPCFDLRPFFTPLPFAVGRDYEDAHRMSAFGEIDQIASPQRGFNRRQHVLNNALEYSGTPTMRADADCGVDFQKTLPDPGDVISPRRGSTVQWLDPPRVDPQHFEMQARTVQDIDNIGGVHDVTQGRRPAGIEAGVAIARLQEAAQTRIRGKDRAAADHWAEVLTKMLAADSKKADRVIFYQGTQGEPLSISPSELAGGFYIRFAEGSGLPSTRDDLKALAKELYAAGLTDAQDLMEKLDYPDWRSIQRRMVLQAQGAPRKPAKAVGGKGKR